MIRTGWLLSLAGARFSCLVLMKLLAKLVGQNASAIAIVEPAAPGVGPLISCISDLLGWTAAFR
jgi:hypothetical protein